MLNCKEVSRLVASGELERVGWARKLELRMHMMMCKYCRLYYSILQQRSHELFGKKCRWCHRQ